MQIKIRKVAVIGSGVMGSRIACHFANIGVKALLLDIVPKSLNEEEEAKGLTLEDKPVRNRIVNHAFQSTLKSKPAALFHTSYASRVETGNLEDDLHKIKDCDWVIEAVVENLEIKHSVYSQIEQYRKPGTLISTNTSGIPINWLIKDRSEDFVDHFCGTHFFNPPRYLKLLEIIPSQKTKPEVVEFFKDYGDRFLGKTVVECKDTPAFIANRIGVLGIMNTFQLALKHDLTVTEIDQLTGPIIGRAKSATFRTSDVVGLDTLVHVANGLVKACPEDEAIDQFKLPEYLQKMVDNKMLGSKTGKGFYKKTKDESGKKKILALDLESLDYREESKSKFDAIGAAKQIDELKHRFKVLLSAKDKAGAFYRDHFYQMFSYVSHRVPEITEDFYRIDEAVKAGFGWEMGPFEIWDALGLSKTVSKMKEAGFTVSKWVDDLASTDASFYSNVDGQVNFASHENGNHKPIPGRDSFIILDDLRQSKTIWSNSESAILDLGDGILNFEFRSKMNTLGGDVLNGMHKAIDLAEQKYDGLVIANQGPNFSVGANLGMIFMMAAEQDYDELNFAVKTFQDTMMRIRYSDIPVVVGLHQMALGGGTEASMHADAVQASAETYMGLVEFGVGVIPGGGGTKEMAKRFAASLEDGDIELNRLRNAFLTIGQAKVSTSAVEAFDLGLLQKGKDQISIRSERVISDAKAKCLLLAQSGYSRPISEKIRVVGRQGLGMVWVGAESMKSANYMSEHDELISQKLGWVMCGGDLSEPTEVSEQYLLDLEREAFLSLCGERKTLERIQHMIQTGKPLRN